MSGMVSLLFFYPTIANSFLQVKSPPAIIVYASVFLESFFLFVGDRSYLDERKIF